MILCLYYCSISWATFRLNGLAAKRTWKVHTDGFSAVGPDGFSAVLSMASFWVHLEACTATYFSWWYNDLRVWFCKTTL